MPFKTFTAGTSLPAADVQTYLMKQAVMVFANSSARASAITSPTEGMITYLSDSNALNIYDGSNWVGAVNTSSLNGYTGVTYADVGVTGMATYWQIKNITIPSSKLYVDVVSVIPLAGLNDYVGMAEWYMGPWSGVLGANQILVNCRLGNAVASTTGTFRFYFRSV